jgi:gliding motility-associated-like protein
MQMQLIRKSLLACSAFLAALSLDAQIVNPNFEIASAYPSTTGQWQVLQGWNNAGSSLASPDYYHYFGSSQADVPETPMAMVDPAEGQALMGMILCGVEHSNTREYISTQLSSPLELGKEYMVSFKLCNGYKTDVSTAGLATSDIGIHFSVNPALQNGQSPIIANPQFTIDTVFYSREWVNVSFVLNASEAYRYMTFGLFGPDNTKVIEVAEGSNPMYGYYFVDDFFMQELPEGYDPTEQHSGKGGQEPNDDSSQNPDLNDLPDHFFVPNTFTPNGDGNNDSFLPISTIVEQYDLEVFNRWGERLYKACDPVSGWDGSYNSQRAEGGAYVWEITYMITDANGQPKKKTFSGIVNLVR